MADQNHWLYYGTKTLQVCPYMPGAPVYKDGVLPHLYTRTRDEGKIETLFCGDIKNLDAFVSYFESRKTMQVLCEVEDNKDLKPVGYCWVDNSKGVDGARMAHCGFCFFGPMRRRNFDLGKLAIAYWMTAMRIDVIFGILLAENFAARKYALKMGFEDHGFVPRYHYFQGELVGARVMSLEKHNFIPGFEKWYAVQNPVEAAV